MSPWLFSDRADLPSSSFSLRSPPVSPCARPPPSTCASSWSLAGEEAWSSAYVREENERRKLNNTVSTLCEGKDEREGRQLPQRMPCRACGTLRANRTSGKPGLHPRHQILPGTIPFREFDPDRYPDPPQSPCLPRTPTKLSQLPHRTKLSLRNCAHLPTIARRSTSF